MSLVLIPVHATHTHTHTTHTQSVITAELAAVGVDLTLTSFHLPCAAAGGAAAVGVETVGGSLEHGTLIP